MIPELNFCVYSLSKTFTKLKVGLPSNPSLFLEIFISRHRKARNSVTFGWSCHQKICVRLNLSIYQIYPLTMPQGTALLIVTTALSVIKFLLCKILHYVQIDTCDPYKTITRVPTKAFLTSSDSSFFFWRGRANEWRREERSDAQHHWVNFSCFEYCHPFRLRSRETSIGLETRDTRRPE